MRKAIVLILALLLATPWLWNEYSADYFSHTSRVYYPHSYFGPARTGLPSGTYYPHSYANSNGWFRSYREYTYAAYRYPGTAYMHAGRTYPIY